MQDKHRCSGAGSIHHTFPLCLQLCNNLGRLISASLSSAPSSSNPRSGIECWWTHTRVTQLTDVFSFLSPRQRKNKSTEISPDRDDCGFLLFLPLSPLFFYPSVWTGLWMLIISPTLCCTPSLPNRLDRSANHHTPGISLSLALLSPLSPSLPCSLSLSLSLSYCGGLQCSPNPDWSSVIGLTLSSPARGGVSFCSDSILSSLTVSVTSLCGVVVIWKKKKKLLLRFCTGTLDATTLKTQPAA